MADECSDDRVQLYNKEFGVRGRPVVKTSLQLGIMAWFRMILSNQLISQWKF